MVCRALVRSLPASLAPAAAAQLTALAGGWLAPPAATASSGGGKGEAAAAAQAQLQAEAIHLLLGTISSAKAKLPVQATRQLLQQACRLCHQPPRPAGSVAAQELACGCMDLLAQLPQWYPQAPKPELAAAGAAVAAVLERQQGAAREDTAPTTRLLCKALRALQVLLAEVRLPV